MSKRKVQLFLADMLTSIEKIERYTAGVDFERFTCDDLLVDAVVRNLEIIGEAARHIPDPVRQHYPEIPWQWAQGFGFAFQNLCALNPHSIRLSSALPML